MKQFFIYTTLLFFTLHINASASPFEKLERAILHGKIDKLRRCVRESSSIRIITALLKSATDFYLAQPTTQGRLRIVPSLNILLDIDGSSTALYRIRKTSAYTRAQETDDDRLMHMFEQRHILEKIVHDEMVREQKAAKAALDELDAQAAAEDHPPGKSKPLAPIKHKEPVAP